MNKNNEAMIEAGLDCLIAVACNPHLEYTKFLDLLMEGRNAMPNLQIPNEFDVL